MKLSTQPLTKSRSYVGIHIVKLEADDSLFIPDDVIEDTFEEY